LTIEKVYKWEVVLEIMGYLSRLLSIGTFVASLACNVGCATSRVESGQSKRLECTVDSICEPILSDFGRDSGVQYIFKGNINGKPQNFTISDYYAIGRIKPPTKIWLDIDKNELDQYERKRMPIPLKASQIKFK